MVRIFRKEVKRSNSLVVKFFSPPSTQTRAGGLVNLDAADLDDIIFLGVAAYQPVVAGRMGFTRATSSLGLKGFVI